MLPLLFISAWVVVYWCLGCCLSVLRLFIGPLFIGASVVVYGCFSCLLVGCLSVLRLLFMGASVVYWSVVDRCFRCC